MTAWGDERALSLLDGALDVNGAAEVELVLTRSDSALTRFAESVIHQNTARIDGEVRVRVVVEGPRVGVVATNDLTPDGLRRATAAAVEIARLTPPSTDWPGVAEPAEYAEAGVHDEATAACTPAQRADLVARLLSPLATGVIAAGTVETAEGELVVVNSRGLRAYHRSTRAAASILASGEDSTGFAESSVGRLDDLDPEALGLRVDDKVRIGHHPRDVPAGDYAVVLEPSATSTLVTWLSWLAFGGKAVHEGRSVLSGRLGERLCDERVTIVDDPLSPLLPGAPFDFEGVPTRRLPLIENGVAVNVVHDRASAYAAGAESTGHALPAPNPEGPLPLHPMMEPGSAPTADLIAGCERGIFVTRFHYTNSLHPIETMLTGMTRDGTFLIEDGAIAGGVHNLRFTQSIVAALNAVEDVGSETEIATDLFFGAGRAPAVRLSSFAFSSTTDF